jgi:hypothetical protein
MVALSKGQIGERSREFKPKGAASLPSGVHLLGLKSLDIVPLNLEKNPFSWID